MVARAYTPDRGEIVWVTLDPQAGREQKGRRPALVISPKSYNKKSGLALVCPITSKTKGYPFEVAVDELKEPGTILADQIKNIDWRARKVKKITTVSSEILLRTQHLVAALISDS